MPFWLEILLLFISASGTSGFAKATNVCTEKGRLNRAFGYLLAMLVSVALCLWLIARFTFEPQFPLG